MLQLETLPIGFVLGDEYRIEEVLGSGGFGITYRAKDTTLDLTVAVKEYFPRSFAVRNQDHSVRAAGAPDGDDVPLQRVYDRNLQQTQGFLTVDASTAIKGDIPHSEAPDGPFNWGLERFMQEAQVLARLKHPNIVRVFRAFRLNGTAYMSLELVEGDDLSNRMQSFGALASQAGIDRLLSPLLDALEVVHGAGLLHRDICPRNILLRSIDESPVLLDFGSAHLLSASSSVAILTPLYAPYEQYLSDVARLGPWTDIYGLAATTYHLIRGEPPPEAPQRVLEDLYEPLSGAATGRGFRPEFLAAVDWGLSVLPENRPQSAAEWRHALLAESPVGDGPATKIFISYRRNDSRHIAGRIFDKLAQEFGADELFFDVDSIPIGVDFRTHVATAIERSAVVVAIIGPGWAGQNWGRGRGWLPFRRKTEDFVEIEIQLALEKGVPILPVTVEDTPIPDRKSLPPSLQDFVYLNACPVRSGRDFRVDIERVMSSIRAVRNSAT